MCMKIDQQQQDIWDDWFKVALATSIMEINGQDIAVFSLEARLESLYSHSMEAGGQLDQLSETTLDWSQWVEGISHSQAWDLMVVVWGRLEETIEKHKISMASWEVVSKWLEKVVWEIKEDRVKSARTQWEDC